MGRSGDLPQGTSAYLVTAEHCPDDTGCPILHVDMDAFFASVSLRERPELRERPVIVAGGSTRGVVLSANYLARTFGVHSAMPAARAKRLCPQGVFLPPEPAAYREVSAGVMRLFREISPLVEPLSLDEAFIDVGGALRRLDRTPAQIGADIRAEVFAAHAVSCSVGVASTKFVAKLASGMAKPDGMLVVPHTQSLAFLHPLPVSALWGVGARSAEKLRAAGFETVADIAAEPVPRLRRVLGTAAAEHLYALAHGRDERAVVPDTAEKSLGAEETFDVDQTDRGVLRRELLRLAERTAAGLRSRGLTGRTVSIKVRFADFSTITRARTLPVATDVTQELYRTAVALLHEQVADGPVRLIGVRVEQLGPADGSGQQLSLGEPERGWREADHAADTARSRFGGAAVRPASLLGTSPRRSGFREPKPDERDGPDTRRKQDNR